MWKYNYTPENNELYHWGIRGMKWGRRRYQNPDGTLTPAGKKRYRKDKAPDHDDYTRAHAAKGVNEMSTSELNERNKRLNAEQQYKKLTQKTSTVKKVTAAAVTATATVNALTTAYKTFKPIVETTLDKVGDHVVKDIVIDSIH